MAPLRPILLLKDSLNDIELTIDALERSRLANPVVVARDGVEALDILLARGAGASEEPRALPVVVLLDINLPRVDGLEVLRAIRRDARTHRLPVVMLTSSREEQALIQSYGLGVNAFVPKPVNNSEFFEAIRDIGAFWAVLNEPPPASLTRSSTGEGS